MSAIKRSESPGKAGGLGVGGQQKIARDTSGNDVPATTTSKLVFGLSARTNRMKHDEYAEQRLKASTSNSERATKVTNSVSLTCDDSARAPTAAAASSSSAAQSARVETVQKITTMNSRSNSLSNQTKVGVGSGRTVRASSSNKHNSNKSQDLSKASASVESGAVEQQQVEQQKQREISKHNKENKAAVRARNKSPVRNQASGGAAAASTSSRATTATTARRKSNEEKRDPERTVHREQTESGSNDSQVKSPNTAEQLEEQQVSNSVNKPRSQFGVLPAPQLAMATTGRGSMVSYAKSRIYDKPNKPILSNPPLVLAPNDTPSSLVFAVGDIPYSILSGRKPPKQVYVSKARKEWEGGEPFAKCRSSKRLAAAQKNKNKLLIHESWSMTSVVATQQYQLQQALAAAQTAHRSNIQQSDPSVKVLTSGSVLERVQQFERAPSSASLSSLSASSSSSSLISSSFGDEEDEVVLTIDTASNSCASAEPRPLSPGGSKQAAYKYKVCSIQQQQQQQHNQKSAPADKQQASSVLARYGAGTTDGARQQQRRFSFVRRSSLNRTSTSNMIPKFYHPHGTKPNTYEIELEKRNIVACFDRLPERRAQLIGPNSKRHFHSIALACGFSEYYKIPLLLYVKHQLDNNPELILDEASKLSTVSNGYSSLARRRSSLVPLNPNNVPTVPAIVSNGMSSAQKNQITRSNSQQLQKAGANGGSAPNDANKTVMSSGTKSSLLQKSASIDSSGRKEKFASTREVQYVDCEQFLACWKQLVSCAYDAAARFTHLLTLGRRDYLLPDDFVPLVQSVIDDHPGLKFLRAAPDFHMRYIQTVIARIYYCVNKSWTGKIKLQELRRSNFLAVLQVLSQENDINQITDYFSYEHFYVIYCKFWSLDQDHDLLISKEDLARHNDASISSRIIERIFSGIVSKQIAKSGKMSYSDFVWFLIAEEDKKHPRSIEYWFRLMDLDGDGYISMYEMEYFYYEQMKRLELMNIEPLPFLDTACQILDLVNPKEKNKISLADLKRTRMATIFFDTFVNLEKYLEHESREFVSTRDIVQDGMVISDWDRYASEEYENMVTEESSV